MKTQSLAAKEIQEKRTPGPWKYGEVSREIYAQSGREICTLFLPGTIDGEDAGICWDDDIAETASNARLIAAAPETARQRDELARSHDQLFKIAQRFEAHLRNRIADGPPMTDDECLSALSDVMGALSRGAKLEGIARCQPAEKGSK